MTYSALNIKDIRVRTAQKISPTEDNTQSHPTEQMQYEMNFDVSSDIRLRASLRQENKTSLSELINS